jgi:ATP-dependent DNA helicase RecG
LSTRKREQDFLPKGRLQTRDAGAPVGVGAQGPNSHALDRWENQIAEGYQSDDLDLPEINQLVMGAINAGRLESRPASAEEALDRLNLRVDSHLLRAAVVLFGRRLMPFYPQCGLRMARFRGTTKTEFLDQKQLHGHAFRLLEEASLFLHRHVPVAGRIERDQVERQDRPLYPPLALREALVNALCHRDYSIAGGAVNVAMYDDRLEIISSGLLPAGVTVADLKQDHLSRPRNPLIADAFFRRGWIERWGRGTQKIVELCQMAGQPEPELEEQAGDVVVRFRPSGYSPPLRVGHNLTDRQRQILQVLSDGAKWTFPEIYRHLDQPPAQRTVQAELRFLRELGLVASSGRGSKAR